MSRKKRATKPKRKRCQTGTTYSIGDVMRVRPGITDSEVDDLPIGAWTGTIVDVDVAPGQTTYLIEWDSSTSAAMPAAYRHNCARRGLDMEKMWLDEDEIGPSVAQEAPGAPPTRALVMNSSAERIGAVFGVTGDDPFPEMSEETLHIYHRHLIQQLTFPIDANVEIEHTRRRVRVIGLLDADEADEKDGLLCEALRNDETVVLPLSAVKVRSYGTNRTAIEEYAEWLSFSRQQEFVQETFEQIEDAHPKSDEDSFRVIAPSHNWRSALFSLAVTGVVGAALGTVFGAAIASLPYAAAVVSAVAALVGLLLGFVGAPTDSAGRELKDRRCRWISSGIAAGFGTIVGALLGAMISAFLGALLGALIVGFLWKCVEMRCKRPMPVTFVLNMIVGALIGVECQAWLHNADDAWSGIKIGAVAGVIAGPLLFFLASGLLVIFEKRQRS